MFNKAGEYELNVEEANNKFEYYTFLPKLLCDGLDITMDQELCGLLANAHRLLGMLEGIALYVQNIEYLETMYIKKESYISCRIDGSRISFEKIFGQSKKRSNDLEKIYNCTNAIELGKKTVSDNKMSNTLLCEMHSTLTTGKDCEKSGAFRTEQLFELPKIYTPGFPTYNPPTPKYVEIAMGDLEKFISKNDKIDVLIKVSLIYYQLQTISPFENENGKIGRMLINLFLQDKKILTKQLLCYSNYILQNKSEYKEILSNVRVAGNYTQWIKFFIKGIIVESNRSINIINELVGLNVKNREKVAVLSKSKKSVIMLLDYLERNPVITIKNAAKELEISFNTALNAIEILQEMKILTVGNDLMRNRSYEYREYLEILEGK